MTGNKKVLLSGASGFIGSHIAISLIKAGYCLIATKRSHSNLWRCKEFCDQINWIDITTQNWENLIIDLKPEILIHTAWEGLNSFDRNDWELQSSNFEFSKKIFNVAIDAKVKKIISLGSQAEYGIFSQRINEHFLPNPADAYGATKLHTSNYLRLICQQNNIQWFWLRIFSTFGPKEKDSWLIPHVVRSLQAGKSIELTLGEQRYDYMYIGDFCKNLYKLINSSNIKLSGIYNYSSGTSVQLKEFLIKLASALNVSDSLLNFGAIPYRSIQSMHMEGDCTKFISIFGNISTIPIELSIRETVDYYKHKE